MFTFEVAPLDDEYKDELYDNVQEMRDQIQRLSARVFAAEKGKGRQFDSVEPPQQVGFPGRGNKLPPPRPPARNEDPQLSNAPPFQQ